MKFMSGLFRNKNFNRRNIGNGPSGKLFDLTDPVMKASAEETFRQMAAICKFCK